MFKVRHLLKLSSLEGVKNRLCRFLSNHVKIVDCISWATLLTEREVGHLKIWAFVQVFGLKNG